MGRVFILHPKNENKVITEADAFREADKQEKTGISPRYSWRDSKTGEPITQKFFTQKNICAQRALFVL